jgi:glycosyltransferase involved in cell wall biosynthesis
MGEEAQGRRRRILVVIPNYVPGYKSGGPVRSVEGLVAQLGEEATIRIVTSDRDLGDRSPYPDLATGIWHGVGRAEVMYLSRRSYRRRLGSIIADFETDVVYLNVLFSPTFALLPVRLARRQAQVLLAPRGSLSGPALALKAWKKELFLTYVRRTRRLRDVTWLASTPGEADEIAAAFADATIVVAPDLDAPPTTVPHQPKQPDRLRVLFASRISPKKNLHYLLSALARVRQPVALDVVGPIEDKHYWHTCLDLADRLPPEVTFRYRGMVPPERVMEAMADHDLFALPTLNENFGHAILEALTASTPVLISDRTPWRDLSAQHAGWDLSLEHPEQFVKVIEDCARMGEEEYSTLRKGAAEVARRWRERIDPLAANRAALGLPPA